ncbi:hypothetical protein [Alicyclobacillus fodiniaquatilis]|uniref:Uncharacterized protein n=1 Tax=Alicyclobacillus fodiniaquatilis TaxID=1661150 RepID=A0ABW4JL05_9BACL
MEPNKDEIRMLMERMRDEMAREWSGETSAPDFADWSSRACGAFGATLYQRARAISKTARLRKSKAERRR